MLDDTHRLQFALIEPLGQCVLSGFQAEMYVIQVKNRGMTPKMICSQHPAILEGLAVTGESGRTLKNSP